MKVLIPTSTTDFDPTEVAVPWQILRDGGVEVIFATDTGRAATGDQRMLDGHGFGLLKKLLIAQKPARQAYAALLQDPGFQTPIRYEDIKIAEYDGLLLPGGHAKGTLPYLESNPLQQAIAGFFTTDKPVAAICHGVVAAFRAIDPATGKSVLYGRKTTALLKRQEMLAYNLTRLWLGDYYRTYPETVEDEVKACLKSPDDFRQGPLPIFRDTPKQMSRGFTVQDGNYLSARWPGDAYSFGSQFLKMLKPPLS